MTVLQRVVGLAVAGGKDEAKAECSTLAVLHLSWAWEMRILEMAQGIHGLGG